MTEYTEFKPILPKNQVLNYYQENNLPFPKNEYFNNYFNDSQNDTVPENKSLEWDFSQNYIEPTDTRWNYVPPVLQTEKINIPMNIPDNEITREIKSLNINDDDKTYLIRLAQKESSFRPYVTNRLGYYGLYQFGNLAFKDVGQTKESFQDTINQHNAALKLASLNERRLQDILDNFVGKEFNGIKVTRNGIRAAAHLLGAATVRDYFQGTRNTKLAQQGFKDANGTTIEKYLRMFS